VFKSYVIGAYAFSRDPPFQLLAMSPFPIMHPQFYSGPWADFPQRNIDYVSFPMSLYWEPPAGTGVDTDDTAAAAAAAASGGGGGSGNSGNNRSLVVSFGTQDREGWFARVALGDLLHNMHVLAPTSHSAGAGAEPVSQTFAEFLEMGQKPQQQEQQRRRGRRYLRSERDP